MAIRQSKYIDITSGVGGTSAVRNREFIARCLTTNDKVGIGHILEFDSADSVMEYFGSNSAEYGFAVKYFGVISKSITRAKKISFTRWSKTAVSASIMSHSTIHTTVADYKSSNGKLTFVIDGEKITVQPTLTSVTTLENVASAIQTVVSAKYTGSTATIANNILTIKFGSTMTGKVEPCVAVETTGSQNDLATMLNLTSGAICSDPTTGDTVESALARMDNLNDNCGSIIFLGYDAMTKAEAKQIAQWNAAKNYKYLVIIGRKAYTNNLGQLTDTGAIQEFASEIGTKLPGTLLCAYRSAEDYIEALPAALFANTDYGRTNSTKTFMYQQGDFQAAITNDTTANILDKLNIFYVGQTQYAGGLLDFTQDGNNLDGVETSVYCNEVWLKSAVWESIMNLFLAVEKVPASADGVAMLEATIAPVVNQAMENGTITLGKTLTTTQKLYVDQLTGETDSWKAVENNGYILKVKIDNENNRYIGKYVLVYSKGDSVRKVEGSDILI